MKIVVKDSNGLFFSRKPEVCFTEKEELAHVFTCINEEHAKIVVEKTQMFTSKISLCYVLLEQEVLINVKTEKNKTKKGEKNNAYSSYEDVESLEVAI